MGEPPTPPGDESESTASPSDAHPEREMLLDAVSYGIYHLDPDGRIVTVNDALTDLTGYDRDALVGSDLERFLDAEDVARVETAIRDRLLDGSEDRVHLSVPVFTSSGDTVACEVRISAVREDDAFRGTVGVVREVDDPDAAAEIREAGQRRRAFDALAEASADGIIMLDDESVIRYANPAVERILGYTPEELVGGSTTRIMPERLRQAYADAVERYLETGEKHVDWTYVELPGLHSDGHEVPLAISINEFQHDGEHFFVGTFRDISERKEAERELQESKRQLRTLIQLLPVGVFVADADGRIVEANEAAKEIWGGEIAEAESVVEYDRYTGWWTETGDPVEPTEWPMARALQGEEITDPELIEIEGFDGERRMVLHHAMPIRGPDGEVSRAVVTILDVTEREHRKRKLQRQNKRLDQFASMLAHELRNPLQVAQIYLDFIDDADDATIDEIAEALERIDDIIEVLLVLARGGDAGENQELVSLTGAVKDAWTDTATGESTVEVTNPQVIRANPTHLQQLLENLFRNAVEHGSTNSRPQADDAVEHGSTGNQPTAEDAVEHSDEPVTVRVGGLDDGFYVEDTGTGIPLAERGKVTDAGYTTDGEGIGLGLTFVAELAEAYGWEFAVTESPEGGARFEFTGVTVVTDEE